jgi:hypothetical protein
MVGSEQHLKYTPPHTFVESGATALDMCRGTNTKLRTAEGHNQSSLKGTKVAAQMPAVEREANNMALG